ncbi:unnamed protein product [Adineta steineri]|uniref:Uncharacterized protein n=1 Tax=Adineta steineri TaxID=433720 RepID=A0A813TK50_9BILA|nr:unnamed protein product [Adineta steineri]
MAEKSLRTLPSGKMATTLMAYAQLEIDNSSTCIPRLCKFSIVRVVLNRAIDGGDSNAIVIAVKIQSNKRTFRCCEISLQQDGTLDAPVNLQYLITYPHYFKRDINKIQIYVQRRKNRPMIGYKTLARGEINLNQVIQRPQSLDLHLYSNTNEKVKQNIRSTMHEEQSIGTNEDIHKRPVGYVSIVSLSSTIPTESTDTSTTTATRPKFGLTTKRHEHHRTTDFDKSFNDDDEYIEEEELNSELEDSDVEFNLKNKQQKFNPNMIRNKIIKIFKRKPNQSTNTPNRNTNPITTNPTNLSHQHDRFIVDHQSDFEEDPPSDISDSTIPVDQWSIESVPKPGFTPVEHLQVLKFSEDDPYTPRKSTNPFDSNDSPLDSESSDLGLDTERMNIPPSIQVPILEEKPSRPATTSIVKQLDELYTNDRLPETVIFLYTGINQSNITASKLKEYNLSVISLSTLIDAKVVLNNFIQRIQKSTSQSKQISVIRIALLGDDAFANSFLQSYVECLASRPHEYMNYFRFYFIPLTFSYLGKFLGSLDSQYESLFSAMELSSELIDIRELSQKITRYLKTSQRTLALPVGEVMLNRKGRLPDEDSSPTFLPFFCYVRLGTLSSTSNETQMSSIDDNILLSKSLSLSLSANPYRDSKDSSDDEPTQLMSTSPQSKITNSLIKTSHIDESTSPYDITVDYWTIIGNNNDNQKEKKEGIRTIKSSLKSNIRLLTITRQAIINVDGKISSPLTMTYVTREKKQKSKFFKIIHKSISSCHK